MAEAVGKTAGFRTTALLLTPKNEKAGQEAVVVAVARRGRAGFLKDRSETIAELLNKGLRVCLVDLPGTGEVGGGSVGKSRDATSLASHAKLLGASIPEMQADGLRAIRLS